MHLRILLTAGFFSELAHLSENEILTEIELRRKESYSKMFGYEYKPRPISNDYSLATQDSKKFIDIDLEADVGMGNKLATELEAYDTTLNLPVKINTQPLGFIPKIQIEESNHPIFLEQENGINMERVVSFAQLLLSH